VVYRPRIFCDSESVSARFVELSCYEAVEQHAQHLFKEERLLSLIPPTCRLLAEMNAGEDGHVTIHFARSEAPKTNPKSWEQMVADSFNLYSRLRVGFN